nr:MAG TPA: hypothetical protein [Bacteriophage sp.]
MLWLVIWKIRLASDCYIFIARISFFSLRNSKFKICITNIWI